MDTILQEILKRVIALETGQETLSENQQVLQESIEEVQESVQNLSRPGSDYTIEEYGDVE